MVKEEVKKTFFSLLIFLLCKIVLDFFIAPYAAFYLKEAFLSENKDLNYFMIWFINMVVNYLPTVLFAFVFYKICDEKIVVLKKSVLNLKRLFLDFFLPFIAFSTSVSLIVSFFSIIFTSANVADNFSSVFPLNNIQMFVFTFFAVIVAPIFEELIYRKLLISSLIKGGELFAVLVSAAVFGITHWNLSQTPYALVVGIFLGISYIKSNSIIPPLILHIANNLLTVIFEYLPNYIVDFDIKPYSFISGIATALVNVLGFALFVFAYKKGSYKLENKKYN